MIFGEDGIFEINDCVLIARELALIEEGSGAMDQAVIGVGRVLGDALAMKAGEQRGRASSVETLIVVEHANLQKAPLRGTDSVEAGMLRIERWTRFCQGTAVLDSYR